METAAWHNCSQIEVIEADRGSAHQLGETAETWGGGRVRNANHFSCHSGGYRVDRCLCGLRWRSILVWRMRPATKWQQSSQGLFVTIHIGHSWFGFLLKTFLGRTCEIYLIARSNTKSFGEFAYIDKRNIALAVFDSADIGAVEVGLKSQVLLRPVLLCSQLSESAAEKDLGVFAHPGVRFWWIHTTLNQGVDYESTDYESHEWQSCRASALLTIVDMQDILKLGE